MTIYFSGALVQKKQFGKYYNQIVAYLESKQHTVLQDTTTISLQKVVQKTDQERARYYQQVVHWIRNADVVVVEISFPSTLRIGHEISLAIEHAKPVVALFYENCEPTFLLGLDHELISWCKYTATTLRKRLDFGLKCAKDQLLIRYNFTLPASHYTHLQTCAQKYRIPKSSYIRKLIEDDMAEL